MQLLLPCWTSSTPSFALAATLLDEVYAFRCASRWRLDWRDMLLKLAECSAPFLSRIFCYLLRLTFSVPEKK